MKITDKQLTQIESILETYLDRRAILDTGSVSAQVCTEMLDQFEPKYTGDFKQFVDGLLLAANVITLREAINVAREINKFFGEIKVPGSYAVTGMIADAKDWAANVCCWSYGVLCYDKENKRFAYKYEGAMFDSEPFRKMVESNNQGSLQLSLAMTEEQTYGKKAGASASSPLKFSSKKQ